MQLPPPVPLLDCDDVGVQVAPVPEPADECDRRRPYAAGTGDASGDGDGDGSGEAIGRGPQSKQSSPKPQIECSEPGPPSSQMASLANLHVLEQPPADNGGGGENLSIELPVALVHEVGS